MALTPASVTVLTRTLDGMSGRAIWDRQVYYGLTEDSEYWALSKTYVMNASVANTLLPSRNPLETLGFIFLDDSHPIFDKYSPPFRWSSDILFGLDPVTRHFVWIRTIRDPKGNLILRQSYAEKQEGSDVLWYKPSF